jgi:hypothetical protein
MCGPPDFAALHTCITRLVELSAAGLGTYSAYRAASLCRAGRLKQEDPEQRTWQGVPGRLAPEGLSGQSNT